MINVLIVDDSAFMRQIFKKHINKQPDMNTIATARDGRDALKKIRKNNPDVITLDIEMPNIDGLETLKILMEEKRFNTPILMVSALDHRSNVIDALDLGAFDFLPKPSKKISMDIEEITDELVKKIKAAYKSNKNRVENKTRTPLKSKLIDKNIDKFPVVAVGTSSGGPNALKELLTAFPGNFPGAMIIVQHMPAGFTRTLAERLNKLSEIEVTEAKEGDKLKKGKALIAPGNYHLEINDEQVKLNQSPKKWGVRPCVDYMMETVAKTYRTRTIGIVLTGMGHDGGLGMNEIKKRGGYCIIQDKDTALVYGMPQSVINYDAYDDIAPLSEIPNKVIKIIERKF